MLDNTCVCIKINANYSYFIEIRSNGIIYEINVFGFLGKSDVVDPLLKIACTADAPPQCTKKRVQSTNPIFNENFFYFLTTDDRKTCERPLFNLHCLLEKLYTKGCHNRDSRN